MNNFSIQNKNILQIVIFPDYVDSNQPLGSKTHMRMIDFLSLTTDKI